MDYTSTLLRGLGRIGCLLGFTAASLSGRAQSTSGADLLPPYYLPKSPTVSELPRFDTQQLVGRPTGAAQYSVPVATVQAGSLQLPVTLSYAFTGLQVRQPWDLVGVGWSLQAGSSITRQVSGLLDDEVVVNPNLRYNPDSLLAGMNRPNYLKRAAMGEVDTSPDMYSFSLPTGVSGRFVILDTTVVLLPRQPVYIRRILGANYGRGFQVTTPDGVRYQFQVVEVTKPNQANFSNLADHATAWHLTRVISADNTDTLRLHYATHTADGNTRLPPQCTITTGTIPTGVAENCGNVVVPTQSQCGTPADYTFHNVKMFASFVKAYYLDSITTRGVCLQVMRDGSFHEVRRLRLLTTLGQRREVKCLTLYQSPFAGGTSLDYRLRLDSVRESANGLALPAYRFTYQEDGYSYMPPRNSAAFDYWGYANGATANGDNNTTATPTLLADPRLSVAGQPQADRAPNFLYTRLGALLEVRYPTGGTTSWTYEPGRLASGTQPVRVDSVTTDLEPIGYDPNNWQTLGGKRVTVSSKVEFEVQQAGKVRVYLARKPANPFASGGSTNQYRDFNIWRRYPGGDTLLTKTTYRSVDPAWGASYKFDLLPGLYVAQVYCEAYEDSTGLTIYVPFRDSSQWTSGPAGPGVRVAKTVTTAPGSPPLVRTYSYQASGTSSGYSLLPQDGVYLDEYENVTAKAVHGHGAVYCELCHTLNVSSDNRGLGNEYNKYDFYYACITERTGTDQGATAYFYENLTQQFNDVVQIEQRAYKQAASAGLPQRLVESTVHTYWTDVPTYLPLVRLRRSRIMGQMGEDDIYDPTLYEVEAAFVAPQLTTQLRVGEQGDSSTLVTRSDYRQQQLVRTATRTSTGWRVQRYKRLQEYAPSVVVPALRFPGFNPLIETQTWQRPLTGTDSALVAGQVTLYDARWRNPARSYRLRLAQPLPGPNQETQGSGGYTNLLSDTRYEPIARVRYAQDSGELLEQRPTHGEPTSYLVGYAGTLTIAEVQNASYEQIAYTSFEPRASGRWRYDSTGTHRVPGGRTGRWAYQLDGSTSLQRPGLPAGTYELLYWQQGTNAVSLLLDASVVPATRETLATVPNGWQQVRARFQVAAPATLSLGVSPGGSVLLDEVRLHPVGARMRSFTHEPLVGETSLTGPDGRTQTYEYDGLGRLIRTRDEQGRILGQQQYHYAGQQ